MNRLAMMVLKNLIYVPGAWFKLCRYAKHAEDYPETETFAHVRYIMRKAVRGGNVELQVFGREKIPGEGGFMMYGNHQGLFDVVALVAAYEGPMAAVFKKELKDVPFLKQIITCTKSFALDREDVRQSITVIQAVAEEVKKGRRYLIFPEGTRSKKGNEMIPFHGGSFRCALKARCPIVPIAFIDSYKVLDQKGSRPVTVQLHFLDPIPYEEFKDKKSVEIAAMVQERIARTIEENIR